MGLKNFSGSSYECFSASKKGVLNTVDPSIKVMNQPHLKTIESFKRINVIPSIFISPKHLNKTRTY